MSLTCGGQEVEVIWWGAYIHFIDFCPDFLYGDETQIQPTDTGAYGVCDADYDSSTPLDFTGAVSRFNTYTTCLTTDSMDEWCRAELPCWDEANCPTLVPFLRVLEWTGGTSDVVFSGTWGDGDIFTQVRASCPADDGKLYDILYFPRDENGFRQAIFRHDTGELVAMTLAL